MVLVPELTVDRNIIFSVNNYEPGYEHSARLFAAHSKGIVSIAISAANRVENNKNGAPIQPIQEILQECHLAGLIEPEILDYPLDWEMGLWENGVISEEGYNLEISIHNILFPEIPKNLTNHQPASMRRKVRNAKCDVFALWGHINSRRDYFITKDNNFIKKRSKLEALGAKVVCTPEQFLSCHHI